jgi:hypothetical protein
MGKGTPNPYEKSFNQKKTAPGNKPEPEVKSKQNPLEGLVESKPNGKTTTFYLSDEAIENLDQLARQNGCSKSKALDLLLRNLF